MNKFIMCIGPPYSGKTTWAKIQQNLPFSNIFIVSPKDLRKKFSGLSNKQIFNIIYSLILDYLADGFTVILDAENIKRNDRRAILSKIPLNIYREARIFSSSIESLRRREIIQKNSRVEKNRPYRCILNFDMPFYSEGFDKITIDSTSNNINLSALLNLAMDFPQYTPHNSLLLGEHLIKTQKEIKSFNQVMNIAAGAHDLGKLYTQTRDKKSPFIAHYYNHEKVGAYLVCGANDIPQKYKVEVAQLVALHMQPPLVKSREDEFELWHLAGDKLYKMVNKLYAADKAAQAR